MVILWQEETYSKPHSNYFHCFVINRKEGSRVMQVCPLLFNPMTVLGRCATSAFFSEMYINNACYCADMTRSECLLIIYNISAWLQNKLSRTNYLQQLVACSSNQSITNSFRSTLIFQFNIIHYFSFCKERFYTFSFCTKCSSFILMENFSLRLSLVFFLFSFLLPWRQWWLTATPEAAFW